MGVMFPLFHSAGTSPACYQFLSVADSGLVTSTASSLRILLGPMDLCTFNFFRCSLTCALFTADRCSFSYSLSVFSGAWTVHLEPLASEYWGEVVIEHLSLLTSSCGQASILLVERLHIFLSCLFVLEVPTCTLISVAWCFSTKIWSA